MDWKPIFKPIVTSFVPPLMDKIDALNTGDMKNYMVILITRL